MTARSRPLDPRARVRMWKALATMCLVAAGCGSSGEDTLRALVDRMCECRDRDCVLEVNAEMVREATKLMTDPSMGNPVPPALRPRYEDCMRRVMTGRS